MKKNTTLFLLARFYSEPPKYLFGNVMNTYQVNSKKIASHKCRNGPLKNLRRNLLNIPFFEIMKFF